nr:hypothetical protein [Tanacetum cinerariifolium]
MKFSTSADGTCHSFDLIDLPIHEHVQEDLYKDQLDSFLLRPFKGYEPNNDEIGSISLWDEEKNSTKDELRSSTRTSATPQSGFSFDNIESKVDNNSMLFGPSITKKEKQIPKLKDLLSHLEYAFLDGKLEFPDIISSLLSK